MAVLFGEFLRHGWVDIGVEYLVMDPGYDAEALKSIKNNLQLLGISAHIKKAPIFEVVSAMGGNPCYPCARMRRGALYELAQDLGCNKIALGHHYDDGSKRDEVKALIGQLSQTNPQVAANIFHSVDNVNLDAVTGYSWAGEHHGFLEWYGAPPMTNPVRGRDLSTEIDI